MELLLERLLGDYENGRITRRHLIQAMAAAATVSAASAEPTGFHGVSLNHVTFFVSDIERSSSFYRELAGLEIREKKARGQILAMDKASLVLGQTQKIGVDHFCIGLRDFDQEKVVARLKALGHDPQVNVRGEVYVRDPDGMRVQVSAEDYKGQLP